MIGFEGQDDSEDVATPHAKELKEPKGRAAKAKAAKEAAEVLAEASALETEETKA